MPARHRVARRCHRSILQPEASASARDGLVRQLAEATALDHFRSSARGQVRQLLQDRLQLGVTGCGGSRVLRRQVTDGRAKLSAAGLRLQGRSSGGARVGGQCAARPGLGPPGAATHGRGRQGHPSNNQEHCRTSEIRIDVSVHHSTAGASRRTSGAGGGISTAIPQSDAAIV